MTLSCNNGPTAPDCTNFFAGAATVDVTLSGQVGPAPSCTLNTKRTAMPASQASCSFSVGSGGIATINGTITAQGTATVDFSAGMLAPCSYAGGSLTGTGTISGSTITGTVDSASPQTHVTFTIRKP